VNRGESWDEGTEVKVVGGGDCEVVELGELKVSKNDGNLDPLG
jgi:hypothetical protein